MSFPLTTPCAHNFCKSCLVGSYAEQSFVRERTREGGRTLRTQKIVKKCPSCLNDISDFLQNPQVNRELMDLIESIEVKPEENTGPSEETSDALDKSEEDGKRVEESAPNNVGTKTMSEESDSMDGVTLNEITSHDALDKKLTTADGDSLVNAVNSKAEDGEKENLNTIGRITRSSNKRKASAEEENPNMNGRTTRASSKKKTNVGKENPSPIGRITRSSIKRNTNPVQNQAAIKKTRKS